MQTILLTGGAGYIGTVLTEELLKKNYRVVCLDRLFFGKEKLEPFLTHPHYEVVQADVRTFDPQILAQVDVVVDLASLSNDPLGELVKEKTLEINYQGRLRVNALAKQMGVKKYILASSCSIYGFNEAWCDETSAPRPLSTYAQASVRAEECLQQATPDFCVTVLRFATVFGVSYRMRFDLAINLMTLKAFKEGAIYVLGQGMQWRPFVHVRDVAAAILRVIEAEPAVVNRQVFNVGANQNNKKIINLAYIIREVLPFETRVNIAPDDADKRSYRVNFDKIANVLHFTPQHSIEDGVREIYDALKQGSIWDYPDTVTVKWYKYLLEANERLKAVTINGEVI